MNRVKIQKVVQSTVQRPYGSSLKKNHDVVSSGQVVQSKEWSGTGATAEKSRMRSANCHTIKWLC